MRDIRSGNSAISLVFLAILFLCGEWDSATAAPATNSALQRIQTETINPEKFDTNLLSMAVVMETNKRRMEHGVGLVTNHPIVAKAAEIQNRIVRKAGELRHVNDDNPKLRKLGDRLKAVGLDLRFAAENLAVVFALNYPEGKPFYISKESGKTVLTETDGGPPIPPHTYATFARDLVEGWMNSPGHRKNLLSPEAHFIGVSCLPEEREKSPSAMPRFYCTQVFFTPMPPAKAGK